MGGWRVAAGVCGLLTDPGVGLGLGVLHASILVRKRCSWHSVAMADSYTRPCSTTHTASSCRPEGTDVPLKHCQMVSWV